MSIRENYIVFSEEDADLEKAASTVAGQVNDAIARGWKPCGGVSVTSVKTAALRVYVVAQAMIKA